MRSLFILAAAAAITPRFFAAETGGGPAAQLNTFGLPAWQSHKTVWASKIVSIEPAPGTENGTRLNVEEGEPAVVPPAWVEKHKPEVGGYFVLYSDGYRSFSPARAFEEGYTRKGENDHRGELAYTAFVSKVGGADRPAWKDLPDVEKRGWNRAAGVLDADTIARMNSEAQPAPDTANRTRDLPPALERIVLEALGEASLCWEPKPTGVFDSERAESIGRGLVARIMEEGKNLVQPGQFPIPHANVDHVMRAKLRANSVQQFKNGEEVTGEQLGFSAVGPSQYPADGSDENNSFAKWSPSASLSIYVANPRLFGVIKEGEEFYVDFVRASARGKTEERTDLPKQPAGEQMGNTLAGDGLPGVGGPKLPPDPGPGGKPAEPTITHLRAKDPAGNDVPTEQSPPLGGAPAPENSDVKPGGELPQPQEEAPKQ